MLYLAWWSQKAAGAGVCRLAYTHGLRIGAMRGEPYDMTGWCRATEPVVNASFELLNAVEWFCI